jgi:hypothetical protein
MEEEDYYSIKFLIEDTFKDNKLMNDVFYDEISDSIISTFNKSLDFDFKENIEYLLFYNDSLDELGKDGIAIVKKQDNYYFILKGHRSKPVIFFLYSQSEHWEINNFFLDEKKFNLTISTHINANIINGEDFYSINDEEDGKYTRERLYTFRFYNLTFLKLFIELCNRINDEVY